MSKQTVEPGADARPTSPLTYQGRHYLVPWPKDRILGTYVLIELPNGPSLKAHWSQRYTPQGLISPLELNFARLPLLRPLTALHNLEVVQARPAPEVVLTITTPLPESGIHTGQLLFFPTVSECRDIVDGMTATDVVQVVYTQAGEEHKLAWRLRSPGAQCVVDTPDHQVFRFETQPWPADVVLNYARGTLVHIDIVAVNTD